MATQEKNPTKSTTATVHITVSTKKISSSTTHLLLLKITKVTTKKTSITGTTTLCHMGTHHHAKGLTVGTE